MRGLASCVTRQRARPPWGALAVTTTTNSRETITMNTTVLTHDPLDLGAGQHDRITFVDCRWHVDEGGTLHIVRERGQGNSAAFASGAWVAVTDGNKVVAAAVQR